MSSDVDLLEDLNPQQRQAVLHRDGPLLVLAGPGSGKTRVITRRAAHLVHSGVYPNNILAITFTNKAVNEMRRRLDELGVSRGMWISTFHSLGARLLREFAPLAHLEPGFTIYDEDDQLRIVKQALELAGLADTSFRPEVAQARIGRAKNDLHTPDQVPTDSFEERAFARVYEHYEQLMRRHNAVDFDDLLLRVALLLGADEEVRSRLAARYRYLLIDEYQDTNRAQYLIASYLAMQHRNLCVTGDPDQSIYAWRGADLRNILEFEQDYPEAQIVRLEQNYRSTQSVLRAADALIARNLRRKHKTLWTENEAGAPVRLWEFDNGHDEAERIAETIAAGHAAGRPYSDFAVFYRINAVSRALEDALRRRKIPYRIARGQEFYGRREIRDVLAYLRVLVNPADDLALLRIINTPIRGIGDTTVARLAAAARGRGVPLTEALRHVGELPELRKAVQRLKHFRALLDELAPLAGGAARPALESVLEETGLRRALAAEDEVAGEDRIANVHELISVADEYDRTTPEPTVAGFLEQVALTSDQDQVDESAGVVLLMTLHAAKGLEFPTVFMPALEQGMLPHERAIQDGDVEEERRLCFVGFTRAQEELFLAFARERQIRAQTLPRSRSQFLAELPESALAFESLRWRSRAARGGAARGEWGEPVISAHDGRPIDPPFSARSIFRRTRREEDDWISFDQPTRRHVHSSAADAALAASRDAGADGERSPFADWAPGTMVTHEAYGVGQVLTIERIEAKRTRAVIRFAREGERTIYLEYAKIRRLER